MQQFRVEWYFKYLLFKQKPIANYFERKQNESGQSIDVHGLREMNKKRRENDCHTSRCFGSNPQKKIITFYRALKLIQLVHMLYSSNLKQIWIERTFHLLSKIEDLSNRSGDNNLHCEVIMPDIIVVLTHNNLIRAIVYSEGQPFGNKPQDRTGPVRTSFYGWKMWNVLIPHKVFFLS